MRIERVHHSQHHRDMPFKDVVANWWGRVRVIMNKMSRHGRRGNGAAQLRELAQAGSRLGSQAPDGVQKLVGAGPGATSRSWQQLLQDLANAPHQQMESFSAEAKVIAGRARSRAISSSMADFKTWITDNSTT
eukprot:1189534-Pyramimonas_sp.AAC.1